MIFLGHFYHCLSIILRILRTFNERKKKMQKATGPATTKKAGGKSKSKSAKGGGKLKKPRPPKTAEQKAIEAARKKVQRKKKSELAASTASTPSYLPKPAPAPRKPAEKKNSAAKRKTSPQQLAESARSTESVELAGSTQKKQKIVAAVVVPAVTIVDDDGNNDANNRDGDNRKKQNTGKRGNTGKAKIEKPKPHVPTKEELAEKALATKMKRKETIMKRWQDEERGLALLALQKEDRKKQLEDEIKRAKDDKDHPPPPDTSYWPSNFENPCTHRPFCAFSDPDEATTQWLLENMQRTRPRTSNTVVNNSNTATSNNSNSDANNDEEKPLELDGQTLTITGHQVFHCRCPNCFELLPANFMPCQTCEVGIQGSFTKESNHQLYNSVGSSIPLSFAQSKTSIYLPPLNKSVREKLFKKFKATIYCDKN